MIQLLQTAMPPSNLSYLIAAFAITGVAFIGYVYFYLPQKAGNTGGDRPPAQHTGGK